MQFMMIFSTLGSSTAYDEDVPINVGIGTFEKL